MAHLGNNLPRHSIMGNSALTHLLSRRAALRQLGLASLSLAAAPAFAEDMIKLPLPSDPRERPLLVGHSTNSDEVWLPAETIIICEDAQVWFEGGPRMIYAVVNRDENNEHVSAFKGR